MTDPTESTISTSSPAQPAAIPTGPRPLSVAICILGLGGLFIANAWKRDFWEPDESLFAHVSRSMEASGDWIVPRSHDVFLALPPLTHWLAAGFHKVTGLDPRLAYRIPATLAAMASLFLTYAAGKRFFDGRIGFLALWIQASTCYFFFRSAWLDDELLFAASTQLAITAFALATRREGRRGLAYLGWAGLAAAGLAKSGFLAAGLVLGSLIVFLFVEGGFTAVKQGLQRVRVVTGLALFALITTPWFLAAGLREGARLWTQYLVEGHFARLMSSPVDPRPPYYYLLTLLWAFLPWTLFLPSGFLHGKDRLRRNGERLTFTWALFMLVALTCVSAKRPSYLLVIWPPMSLLIAAALFETRESFTVWEDLLREGVSRVLPVLLKVPFVLVLLVAAAYFGGYLEKLLPDDRAQALLTDHDGMSWTLGLLGVASGVLFAVSGRVRKLVREKEVTRAAFELACAAVFLCFTGTFLFAAANPFESGRAAVEKLSPLLPAEASIATYGRKRASVFYYLGEARPLTHLDYPGTTPDDSGLKKLEDHLKQSGAAFIITSRAELEMLRAQFPSLNPVLIEKQSARLGWHEELVLLGNR